MKKEVLLRDNSRFDPVMAIVVYANGTGLYYLERHEVTMGKKEPTFGPGSPMLQKTLVDIVGSISDNYIQFHDEAELIPENLLLNVQTPGKMNIIWFLHKPVRCLYFDSDFKLNEKTKITLPSMLFQWKNNSLNVFCFIDEERPGPKTKLFVAPYPNTGPSGRVCLGNAKVDMETNVLSKFIKSVEKAFFDSRFTHGGDGNVKSGKFLNVIKDAYKKKAFPLDELKESSLKFTDLLKNP